MDAPLPAEQHQVIDPGIIQSATAWMARLWAGDANDDERAACMAWRAAHPDHELAWNRLQALGNELIGVPRAVARRVLLESPPASISRRAALRFVVAVTALGGAAYSVRRTDAWEREVSDYAANTGEIRSVSLPDSTRMVLDTASAADVRYTAEERRVILNAGQILISTAADPAPTHRPFTVECRYGTIRALGTRFSVRQEGATAGVCVYDGAVEIRPARTPDRVFHLDAGQRTTFSDAQVQPLEPTRDASAAWVRGHLVAEHLRIADFIAELGRYRPGLLTCDHSVSELRVTGVFPLWDTDRALTNLMLAVPVEIVRHTRYWVTVRAR